jgi:membrane fusion protein (multidrug efflux system)
MTSEERPSPQEKSAAAGGSTSAATTRQTPPRIDRRQLMRLGGAVVILLLLVSIVPRLLRALATVSTDDAYVSGHVTFVAPRVAGQVATVLVDDNNRVRKGDVLVALDKEPYQVRVQIAEAAVATANANLAATKAETRGLEGKARSLRFNLEKAIEAVNNKTALLRAKVATLQSKQATLARVQVDYDRESALVKSGVSSQQRLDNYKEARRVAEAQVEEAQQGVYQVRVSLGLPAQPTPGEDLAQVPSSLSQSFSAVKQAQGELLEVASRLGVVTSLTSSPEEMIAEFYKRDPEGNIDRIYEQLARDAPAVKQAEAKLAEAERKLDKARLDLRYCDVVAEIDGVVTRRSVNPGNNVIVGQALMAVRSLTDIWVDANFKETQLAALRIGQPVELDVDMYGSHAEFRGRISGFTNGTGSTLALLPAENATGNFVKVVQRLPVRIDLIDYDPEKSPLFIGLSVTPHVLVREKPSGPNAGEVLQPYATAPQAASIASPATTATAP